MKKNSVNPLRRIVFVISVLVAATIFLAASDSFAFRRHRPLVPKHPPPFGRHVRELPRGYVSLTIGGVGYFFQGGLFYERGPRGFVVVRAPLGAVVAALPIGFRTVIVDDVNYYYCEGVYYRKIPAGYEVVEPPDEVVVVEEEAVGVKAAITAGDSVKVVAQRLNVRSGPGADFAVIKVVQRDVTLEVHGGSPDWLYVKLPSGKFGWVKEEFVTLIAAPASG